MIDARVLPTEVVTTIHHLAFRSGHRFIRFGHSRQDLVQELTLHYLHRQKQHDPNRACASTFAARICQHRLFTMASAEIASKRYTGSGFTSLSEWEPNEPSTAGDWLTPEQLALRIDIERTLAKLPPELVSIASVLAQGLSATDAGRVMGIPRATLYRRLARLRQAFSDAGLRAYLTVPRRRHAA